MVSAGIDVGTRTTKVVLLDSNVVLFSGVSDTEESAETSSRRILEEGLGKVNLSLSNLASIVATGIGQEDVIFASIKRSEQTCHARGAYWLYPSAHTVIDLGQSGMRVMKLDSKGRMVKFATNPKCAAGTGVFLDSIAHVLGVPVQQMGEIAAESEEGIEITGFCAVFAESEVISHINRGERLERIIVGIHESAVNRLIEVIGRVGVEEEVVVTGGVAKNRGIIKALERRLGLKVNVPAEPQIVGALGAALIGQG